MAMGRPAAAGTYQELEAIRLEHPQLTGKASYNKVCNDLQKRNSVQAAAEVKQLYATRQYDECRKQAMLLVHQNSKPSEAIQAKMLMILAQPKVTRDNPQARERHAQQAIALWQVVLARSGSSRFPIDQATEQLKIAEDLLNDALQTIIEGKLQEIQDIQQAMDAIAATRCFDEGHSGTAEVMTTVEELDDEFWDF